MTEKYFDAETVGFSVFYSLFYTNVKWSNVLMLVFSWSVNKTLNESNYLLIYFFFLTEKIYVGEWIRTLSLRMSRRMCVYDLKSKPLLI